MIFQIGEIHCMPQTDISQMQFLERKMPQHIHISHESYPEIFGYERGNGIFVGRFADNIRLERVGGISPVSENVRVLTKARIQ